MAPYYGESLQGRFDARLKGASAESGSSSGNAYAQQKPNIVLVLMDNLGWGEPGAYGGGSLRGAPTGPDSIDVHKN